MKCPCCGTLVMTVLETRLNASATIRRRRYLCENGDRFTTKEELSGDPIPAGQPVPNNRPATVWTGLAK